MQTNLSVDLSSYQCSPRQAGTTHAQHGSVGKRATSCGKCGATLDLWNQICYFISSTGRALISSRPFYLLYLLYLLVRREGMDVQTSSRRVETCFPGPCRRDRIYRMLMYEYITTYSVYLPALHSCKQVGARGEDNPATRWTEDGFRSAAPHRSDAALCQQTAPDL